MKKIGFLLILSLSFVVAKSQNMEYKLVANKDKIQQKLLLATAKIKTINSNFIQEKNLEYLSTIIKSEGKFWFKNGNKLRWEYTKPFSYIITINNGIFTIKDNEKTNVFDVKSNKAFKELNDILISTVDGSLMNSNKFDIEIYENVDNYKVKLEPKQNQMKEILKNIYMYFAKTDYSVDKVKMMESEKDYTIIKFTNKKLNQSISDNLF